MSSPSPMFSNAFMEPKNQSNFIPILSPEVVIQVRESLTPLLEAEQFFRQQMELIALRLASKSANIILTSGLVALMKNQEI